MLTISGYTPASAKISILPNGLRLKKKAISLQPYHHGPAPATANDARHSLRLTTAYAIKPQRASTLADAAFYFIIMFDFD
jgi:hypothetical protein